MMLNIYIIDWGSKKVHYKEKSMAEKRLFFLLNVTILILIVLSSCNAYKLFRDSGMSDILIDRKLFFKYLADSIRPVKLIGKLINEVY